MGLIGDMMNVDGAVHVRDDAMNVHVRLDT
jgi:hypothetical protein